MKPPVNNTFASFSNVAGAQRMLSQRICKSALELEYRLSVRVLAGHDLREGVRALLIDKDRTPRWQPGRMEDVDPAAIEALFAPLPEGEELLLPERPQSPLAIE